MEDGRIEIVKTQEYLDSTLEVSKFIADLPLTHDQNNQLVKLLVDHDNIGRNDAFMQGFKVGMDFKDYTSKMDAEAPAEILH